MCGQIQFFKALANGETGTTKSKESRKNYLQNLNINMIVENRFEFEGRTFVIIPSSLKCPSNNIDVKLIKNMTRWVVGMRIVLRINLLWLFILIKYWVLYSKTLRNIISLIYLCVLSSKFISQTHNRYSIPQHQNQLVSKLNGFQELYFLSVFN